MGRRGWRGSELLKGIFHWIEDEGREFEKRGFKRVLFGYAMDLGKLIQHNNQI